MSLVHVYSPYFQSLLETRDLPPYAISKSYFTALFAQISYTYPFCYQYSSLSSLCGWQMLPFLQGHSMHLCSVPDDRRLPGQCWEVQGQTGPSAARCDAVGQMDNSNLLGLGPNWPWGLTVVHGPVSTCNVCSSPTQQTGDINYHHPVPVFWNSIPFDAYQMKIIIHSTWWQCTCVVAQLQSFCTICTSPKSILTDTNLTTSFHVNTG